MNSHPNKFKNIIPQVPTIPVIFPLIKNLTEMPVIKFQKKLHLRINSNDIKSGPKIEKLILLNSLINSIYPALSYFAQNLTENHDMALQIVEEIIVRTFCENQDLLNMTPGLWYEKVIIACRGIYPPKVSTTENQIMKSRIEYWICRTEILRNCHESLLDMPKFCRKVRYLEFLEKLKSTKNKGNEINN
ncbi:MAG: hypothetical protein C5B52_08510 [Bacteroidetes bacterium]|nr:MAG: hypothetical protein C5B52_08510 [Bacteroidota bacterium]